MRVKDDFKEHTAMKPWKKWIGIHKYVARNNLPKWRLTTTENYVDCTTQIFAKEVGFAAAQVVANVDVEWYVRYKAFDAGVGP